MGEERILYINVEYTLLQKIQKTLERIHSVNYLSSIWDDDLRILRQFIIEGQFKFIVLGYISDCVYQVLLDVNNDILNKIQWLLLCEDINYYFNRQHLPIFFALRLSNFQQDLKQLENKINIIKYHKKVYKLHQKSICTSIYIDTIYYIESSRNYVFIHQAKHAIKDRITLKELKEQEIFSSFILISRGLLINPKHVLSINQKRITMDNKVILYMSRAMALQVHTLFVKLYNIK